MTSTTSAQLPRPGMFATVRNRRGVVAAVEPFDGERGRLHLVDLEYKDDQFPLQESLLWDLEQKIRECGGHSDMGVEVFLSQNDGEGWMLPENLCLADYGLGHDERSKVPQPVASRLGPRFYDWQLAQTAEESWRECHLHARNLLGEADYSRMLSGGDSLKQSQDAEPIQTESERKSPLFD